MLYQGDPSELKRFADPERSETALRLTNLFAEPDLVETKPGTFLERGLIHTTSRGPGLDRFSLRGPVIFARSVDRVGSSSSDWISARSSAASL